MAGGLGPQVRCYVPQHGSRRSEVGDAVLLFLGQNKSKEHLGPASLRFDPHSTVGSRCRSCWRAGAVVRRLSLSPARGSSLEPRSVAVLERTKAGSTSRLCVPEVFIGT